MRITCLHTAESNIAVFESAANQLGIALDALHHEVRPELLAAAERAGGLTAELSAATQRELLALAQNADAVVLTCSTLGPSVEGITQQAGAPILRADQALALASVQAASGGKIVALVAVETTVATTTRLFCQAAEASNALVEVQLVSGAWALYKSGDVEGYLTRVAQTADLAYLEGASVVALGQASMGGAASRVTAGPAPLTSAVSGLKAAFESTAESGR